MTFRPGRSIVSAVYGGQHVRDVHVVTKNGRAAYEGETLYSVEGGNIVLTYWSSIGGIGRGTVNLTPGDWTFTITMRATPTAAPQSFATHWKWLGDDAYIVTGGSAAVTYRRAR